MHIHVIKVIIFLFKCKEHSRVKICGEMRIFSGKLAAAQTKLSVSEELPCRELKIKIDENRAGFFFFSFFLPRNLQPRSRIHKPV